MSDNVAIKEGARAYNFTVDKLRTAQQNSDEPVIWVPESTVQLGSLRASENGVYLARSEELYGFNEIVVSVNGAATIGDRAVFPDDSGELQEEYLPHAIVIVTPPRKLIYNDGERIDLRGAVVKAVDAEGNTWTNARYPNGHIPLGELAVDPPNADISKAIGSEWDVSGLGLNSPIYLFPISEGTVYDGNEGDITWHYVSKLTAATQVYMYQFGRGPAIFDGGMISLGPFSGTTQRHAPPGWNSDVVTIRSTEIVFDGHRAYIGWEFVRNTPLSHIPISAPQSNTRAAAVLTITEGHPKNPQQTITLSWARYGDGAVLSTSFNITVSDGFSGGSGNF